MSDDPTRAAAEYAERAGRLSYFVGQLVALAEVRDDVPAEFLRDQLVFFANQVRNGDLVNPDDVARYAADFRESAEYWRMRHGKGRS